MEYSVVWVCPLSPSLVYVISFFFNHIEPQRTRSSLNCFCALMGFLSGAGTAWLACQVSISRETSPAQKWTTAWWQTWLSGRSMKSRWPLTTGLAWASSAGQWPNTPYKEVSLLSRTTRLQKLGQAARFVKFKLQYVRNENRVHSSRECLEEIHHVCNFISLPPLSWSDAVEGKHNVPAAFSGYWGQQVSARILS